MASRRTNHFSAYLLLPSASIAVAGAIFGATSWSMAVAQPEPLDVCGQTIADVLQDIQGVGVPGASDPNRLNPNGSGATVNINSGNNISVQSGPNNTNVQSTTVGDNSSINANNSFTCCVNGRCCVSLDGGPAACTP
ncbi:hypothetical protein MGALJ_24260 [Mycobacterium gallinarum]|uniref:Uncharacterized protein n=1 Tax=Mycobacterium gallinarum TaxID=39689 RepID=A0A9W4FF35_9MYCO|nr:hypothetical protein [Mycobacterium gallinarum]BBY92757.1 hypothetical protein MGALJ_24260 [Mycobacterium gallinarum]